MWQNYRKLNLCTQISVKCTCNKIDYVSNDIFTIALNTRYILVIAWPRNRFPSILITWLQYGADIYLSTREAVRVYMYFCHSLAALREVPPRPSCSLYVLLSYLLPRLVQVMNWPTVSFRLISAGYTTLSSFFSTILCPDTFLYLLY